LDDSGFLFENANYDASRKGGETLAGKYDPFLAETGNLIRSSRKKKQMTQMQLAERVGNECSKNMISCYENGDVEMGIRRFADISRVLEVSPDVLLGGAGSGFTGEAGELFSQLDDENRVIVMKQMKALLLIQGKERASHICL